MGSAGRCSGEAGRPGSSTAQPAAGTTGRRAGQRAGDMQQAASQPFARRSVLSPSTRDSGERAAGASGSDSEATSLGAQQGHRASRSLVAVEGRQGAGQARQAQAGHGADAAGRQHLGPQAEAAGQVRGAAQGAAAASARHQLWAHHQQTRQGGAAACSQQASQAALTEAAQAGAAARSVLLAAALFALQRADPPPTSELTVQDAADAAEHTQQRDPEAARTLPATASAVAESPPDTNKAEATTVHDAERMWTPFEVGEHCGRKLPSNAGALPSCLCPLVASTTMQIREQELHHSFRNSRVQTVLRARRCCCWHQCLHARLKSIPSSSHLTSLTSLTPPAQQHTHSTCSAAHTAWLRCCPSLRPPRSTSCSRLLHLLPPSADQRL